MTENLALRPVPRAKYAKTKNALSPVLGIPGVSGLHVL